MTTDPRALGVGGAFGLIALVYFAFTGKLAGVAASAVLVAIGVLGVVIGSRRSE